MVKFKLKYPVPYL